MQMNDLQDLLVENLKDLYSAEQQILKAGPKMAKKVQNEELRNALTEHLRITEGQVKRLEQILGKMGEKPGGKKCHGMDGLIDENKEMMGEDAEPEVIDAGLIVGQQKVEHYEIAGYGSAVTFARLLGDEEAASLLEQTLDEEKTADRMLTEIAESTINIQAAEGGEEDEMAGASSGGRSGSKSKSKSSGGGGGSRSKSNGKSASRRGR
ncbi:MAG TPA: ferritin-like domain-containing protein [Tepidisphaeraceae bacterium]|nr:ferritin-like domain-containing protein [Tepidisphaeraceae bacterium]